MTESANAILGDDYGTQLPQTQVDPESVVESKKMAKFTRTAEYKRQKEWVESKISFYQRYMPDGRLLSGVDTNELSSHWVAANEIISVLNEFLTSYDLAVEETTEAVKK
jgi:hypothetical protein